MEIKALSVRHFRGINSLDWSVDGRLVCLVGPGDATKSTILDAIGLVLTSRRYVSFDDADFYDANTDEPIIIDVTVGEIPRDLISEARFGYLIRGWTMGGEIRDEPEGDDQHVLTIRLRVDETLEPEWLVVNDRLPEGKPISASDRGKLRVSRIADYADWQFSWGQGSALTRLMENRAEVGPILAGARRAARASLDLSKVELLMESAHSAEDIGRSLGVRARSEAGFAPRLDVRSMNLGASILALHDGPVPLRQSGLGTTRLLSVGLQFEASRAGGITLVDEIEHGLEPHRVRRLVHILRNGLSTQEREDGRATENGSQTFMTTHSPIALCELQPADLRVVRSNNGRTEIGKPDQALRPLLRTNPNAFLARKVVVCEGKTEIGFCRALDEWWGQGSQPLAYVGAALADGEGCTTGPERAISFATLGYRTAYFGDSDAPLNPDEAALESADVHTVVWSGDVSTEERIALDLPWVGFVEMVRLVVDYRGADHMQARLSTELGLETTGMPVNPEDWRALPCGEDVVRRAFAKAAKKKKAEWFKRVDRAEDLGRLVVRYWAAVEDRLLGAGVSRLKEWLYDD